MNRNRRSNSSSIPSLLDMSPANSGGLSSGSSIGYGTTSLASTYGSASSLGGSSLSSGLGLTGGISSSSDSYTTPYGYGGGYSSTLADTSSSLFGSKSGDGLLGSGLSSGLGSGGYGGGMSSSLGAGLTVDDSFAAKVRLQQQLLAEEKQKSIQQQIQEQLEFQNKKRLEYNRIKRERDNRRRDERRNDNRRRDDNRRDRDRDGQKSEGLDDVQVTVKPRSEGRSISDNTGGRKRNYSDKSRSQPRDENKNSQGGGGDSTTQGPWKCHVCVVTCRDLKGYELHMKGRKHSEAMEKMRVVTEYQARQAVKRLEAERHLKKVDGRNRDDDEHYCRDCLTHYTGDLLAHRRTREHKEARRTQRPHCRVCNVTFKTPKKYVAHCNTPGHKKVYEAAKKKGVKNLDDDNFVTVDSVGEFDEDMDNDALLAANVGDSSMGQGFDTTITVTKSGVEEDVINVTDFDSSDMPPGDPQEYVSDALASSVEEEAIDDLVSAQLVNESDDMVMDDNSSSVPVKKKKKNVSNEDLSEYDPTKAVGRDYVIPVWGYYCKPCRQFYQSVGHQGSVLEAHCKTMEHFQAVKQFVEEGEADGDVDYLSMAIAENQEIHV